MITATDERYEEPVKLKRVEAQPSPSSAEYWSPRIQSLLGKLSLRPGNTSKTKQSESEY
jgi:hypothetical protein